MQFSREAETVWDNLSLMFIIINLLKLFLKLLIPFFFHHFLSHLPYFFHKWFHYLTDLPLSLNPTFLLCFPSSTKLCPRVPFIPSFPPIPFRYSLFLTSNFLCFSLSYCLFYSIVSNLILITSKSLETVILASIHSHARPLIKFQK